MSTQNAILWFRQDLRLHDNESLLDAIKSARAVIPVYIFDPRVFGGTTPRYGFPKTGGYRAKFILESIADLRNSLRQRGNDLVIRVGKPEEILPRLSQEFRAGWVFCNRERTHEEKQVQDTLEQELWSIGREMRYNRGKMLYYTADLPFPISQTPDVFTNFRKETERIVPVRCPLETPRNVPRPIDLEIDYGTIPTLAELGIAELVQDERAAIHHRGGETAGLARLKHYLWDTDHAKTYKETRNGLIGADYSTKFSAWLAQGCLSPKMIYQEVKRYEEERGSNDSTYWIIFELLWRDFFRFMIKKHGNTVFRKGGPKGEVDESWTDDTELTERWIAGETGTPFIDANMREIGTTGFMSNRGRQNVASFLVKDLHVNWQIGAEYFESILIDYDVASNWCNWNYVAGVGSDPRENRYFNILSQAERYDPTGEYVRLWCPELAALPNDYLHKPDQLNPGQLRDYGVSLGGSYPHPIVSSSKWSGGGSKGKGSHKGSRKTSRTR